MIELILGGARSGKSRYAQQRAEQKSKVVTYVATASQIDAEMTARIAHHRTQRPNDWGLVERPLDLPEVIQQLNDQSDSVILVDCLTLWLNNEIYHRPEVKFDDLVQPLKRALMSADNDILLVSNEVGMGIIPIGDVTRQFVDWQGWLNQAVAECADKVTFVAAGLPMTLKENHHE